MSGKTHEQFCDPRDLERIGNRLGRPGSLSGGEPSFLLMSGSFNPIHTQHARILEVAKLHYESRGHMIIGAFLSPSSDDYVLEKLGSEALSFHKRRSLCELAIEKWDWAGVCTRGELSSNWAREAVLHDLQTYLKHRIEARKLTGIEIMGSDVIVRIFGKILASDGGDLEQSAQKRRHICWFRRPGPAGLAEREQIETTMARDLVGLGIKLTLLEPAAWGPPLKNISSSAVRKLISHGDWTTLSSNGWLEPTIVRKLRNWSEGDRL